MVQEQIARQAFTDGDLDGQIALILQLSISRTIATVATKSDVLAKIGDQNRS